MRKSIEASYVENLLKYRQSEEMFCFEDDVRKLEADFEKSVEAAKAFQRLTIAFRTGKGVSEKLFKELAKAKEFLSSLEEDKSK